MEAVLEKTVRDCEASPRRVFGLYSHLPVGLKTSCNSLKEVFCVLNELMFTRSKMSIFVSMGVGARNAPVDFSPALPLLS